MSSVLNALGWSNSPLEGPKLNEMIVKETETLKVNPFHLIVVLGALKIKHEEMCLKDEVKKFAQEPEHAPRPLSTYNFKLGFGDDSTIGVQINNEWCGLNGLFRKFSGQSREDYEIIRPALVCVLLGHDFTSPSIKIILEKAFEGLSLLLKGYQDQDHRYYYETEYEKEQCVENRPRTKENVYFFRSMKRDISLIKEATTLADGKKEDFLKRMQKKHDKFFPNLSKTKERQGLAPLDMHYREKMVGIWNDETIDSIAKSMSAKINEGTNSFTAIMKSVENIHLLHNKINKEVEADYNSYSKKPLAVKHRLKKLE